jgi:hypothetical protein
MVNEPDATTYDDDALTEYIEAYPLIDERGEEPYTWDTSTQPPTKDNNEDWIPTYDLNAAAADIWDEKAATVAEDWDYEADGGRHKRSQVYQAYQERARYYRSRRSPLSVSEVQWPKESGSTQLDWIVNRVRRLT